MKTKFIGCSAEQCQIINYQMKNGVYKIVKNKISGDYPSEN